jgi:hypothetical protein
MKRASPVVLSALALSSATLALTTVAYADSALSDSLPLGGRLFTDIYFPARDIQTSTYRQTSASLWLEGTPKLGENGAANFVLTGDAIQNRTVSVVDGTSSEFRMGLREAYVTYAKNGWELRAGQQIIPWGKSDAINPTDFLTAKDMTFFNPDEEVRRKGAVSLWLGFTPSQGASPWSFTVVATPVFAKTQLLISPLAVPSGVTLSGSPIDPPETLGNTETAIKVAYAASQWDASLIAFRGFNHMPEFTLLGVSGTPSAPVAGVGQTFHPIRAAGGDASFTTGKWVFRAETAYAWTENDDGANPLIQPSHWDSVVGVERPVGDDFRLQGQFVYRYIPAFAPASSAGGATPVLAQLNQGIAQANALLLAYQDRSRPGATFRAGYSNEDNGIDAEIFVLGNFVGGDYLLRPKFSYHWTQALLTTLGVEWYGGPDDRPLGTMKPFSSVFTEAKYSF